MSRSSSIYILSIYNLCTSVYNTYAYSTWFGGGAGVRLVLIILGITCICSRICVLMGLYREIVWCLKGSFVYVAAMMGILIGAVMAHAGLTNLFISIFNLLMAIFDGYLCMFIIRDITNRRNVPTVPVAKAQTPTEV